LLLAQLFDGMLRWRRSNIGSKGGEGSCVAG
jgi:hypothetical protein